MNAPRTNRPHRTKRRGLMAWYSGWAVAALVGGVAFAGPPAHAAGGAVLNAGASGAIEGHYIVALHGATSLAAGAEAAVSAQAEELTGRYGGSVETVYSAALRGFAAEMSAAQARRLAADPRVRYVQQSLMVRAAGPGTQPNPPSWGLDRIDGKSDGSYAYPATGAGVTVYVVDSGIRISHRTFEGRASHGHDFVDEDAEAQDCNGHGTHVSGTIGGKEYGVAKGVKLVGVRVLGCDGSAPDRDTVEGLDWVLKNAKGPSVGNMSLASGGDDAEPQAIRDATKAAVAAGIQFGVAAGNESADACGSTPADVPEAVTVASSTSGDGRSSFSNYGRCVDVFAPGSNIVSASHSSDTGRATMSGTSMAAPHVTGALAIFLEGHPGAGSAEAHDAIVTAADTGVISNPGSGSPNRLLNVTKLAAPPPAFPAR
ncbi:S8 family peptidase [Actinomadura sp. KC06]|uniref:S8 family peptidase n=1 Tax=Actinomadura sp. KC06 TaxID=2530369 RepID=UPI00104B5AE4|nr:S8 family peptidase [Actinomadura sp. KC06]TDD29273.1 S8 family peptidase [Actinomadura sp. KC06]